MDTIENFDFNELRMSSDEIKSTILENHIHLMSQALLRRDGSLVLSIREVADV